MNMFKPTAAATPEEYIAQIDEPRRSEIQKIHDFIRQKAPELQPYMQSGMIGYGREHYKTKSGQEGEWFVLGLASRKNYISVYSCTTKDGEYIAEKYKDKLGKTSVGRSCMRFKKFEDINFDGLKEVIQASAKVAKENGIFA
jgi:uncharacterized protein YdhG (YjbR/CyaY superfamily)